MADVTHLIGIGGVGMSALAQALLDKGCAVSGADRQIVASGTPPPTPVLSIWSASSTIIIPDRPAICSLHTCTPTSREPSEVLRPSSSPCMIS